MVIVDRTMLIPCLAACAVFTELFVCLNIGSLFYPGNRAIGVVFPYF